MYIGQWVLCSNNFVVFRIMLLECLRISIVKFTTFNLNIVVH